MSRKPVSEINQMETRAALWAAIRRLGAFTPKDVRYETRCSRSQVEEYLKGLAAAGIIEKSIDEPGLYMLVKDCGLEAPRVRRDGTTVTQGLGREQMWRTLRGLREFTAVDLAVQASTEEAPVSTETAKEYCHFLALAGYLAVMRAGKGVGKGGELTRYRFVSTRNTGPLPPMIQKVKAVYDPNLKAVVWNSAEGGHDAK
jgi:hypothetical protein